jgi:hypothetical protein
VCYIRLRNLRCDNSQREEKKGEKKKVRKREKPAKKSKISPEGTDVAASLRKKRRFSLKVFAFLSSKKTKKMKKMPLVSAPQNKTEGALFFVPPQF